MSAAARRPRGVLRVGDQIVFDGGEHVVIGLSGTLVRLRSAGGIVAVVAASALQADPSFGLQAGQRPALAAIGLLAQLSEPVLEQARWWERHVLQVETGVDPTGPAAGDGDLGRRVEYDLQRTTLAEREQAKADELTAAGIPTSRATVRRKRARYAASGLWGLVDHRLVPVTSPTGRVDARVVEAVQIAMSEQVDSSTGTRERVRRRAVALLAERYGPGTVAMPSKSTFHRLVGVLDAGRHTFGAATTRRSLANRPDGPFGTVTSARPGELVQIDTTPLDVMVLLEDGVSARVELTILVDLATRTICSGLLRPHGTKAVDAALLLARALVPESMRPGWPEALRMRASRLPHAELAVIDGRLADAAAKPVITPETIVCDRGAVFVSETFLAACARLGISLQPAHPRTPTDKGVVERTFGSINTLFCQFVAGYTGRDSTRRGRDVDGEAVWSLAQLQDLFDQWVLAGWQARPHDGLRHPDLPSSALSPNEMYAAQIAAAGYLPLALSGGDYLELLPVAWRTITPAGIRVGSLTYDSAELGPYRGQPSTHRARRGKWPIHVDPYDLGQVWIRRPSSEGLAVGSDAVPDHGAAGWIEVPWIHRDRTAAPFADFTLRHTRRVLAQRHADSGQLQVADALNTLLDRAASGPDPSTASTAAGARTARRIAAKTRAAATNRSEPAPAEPRPTTADHNVVDEAATDEHEPSDDTAMATVVPFGVFDAHAEARRYW